MAGVFVQPSVFNMGGGIEEIRTFIDDEVENLNTLMNEGFQLLIVQYRNKSTFSTSVLFLDPFIFRYQYGADVYMSLPNEPYPLFEYSQSGSVKLGDYGGTYQFVAIKFKTTQQ